MGTAGQRLRRFTVLPLFIVIFRALHIVKKCFLFAVNIFVKDKMPSVVRTPEERFRGLEALGYTFKPNYVKLPIGGGKTLPRVHYVDEGPRDAKETMVCVHGEPSWSFLYRKMIHVFLKAGYRVIAPDFIGFGKSDKFTDPKAYSHELHTMTLRLLLDHLKVRNATLVCQDWGGLTGLTVVKDSSHLFSRLVIMNVYMPAGLREFSLNKIDTFIPFVFWQSFAQLFGTFLPIYHIFKVALEKPKPAVLEGYAAPFPSSQFRGGAAQWPLLVPLTTHTAVAAEMRATRDFLEKKWEKPVLVMFSDRDSITEGQDKVFLHLCPKASYKPIQGGGHFLQEDKGEQLASHIVNFISGKL